MHFHNEYDINQKQLSTVEMCLSVAAPIRRILMKYILITSNNAEDLNTQVQEKLDEGFNLYEGPSVSISIQYEEDNSLEPLRNTVLT